MNGKEELWMDGYGKVLTPTHLRNVLLTPHDARRDGVLAPLMWSSAPCRIGSSPATSSILPQIRQAHECKMRCLHHCLFPSDENKDVDGDRSFPTVAKAAQPPPAGKLSHPWYIMSMCLCCISRLRTPQGSGLGSAPPHLADGRPWLMGVQLEGVPASQTGIPLLGDYWPKLWSLQDRE